MIEFATQQDQTGWFEVDSAAWLAVVGTLLGVLLTGALSIAATALGDQRQRDMLERQLAHERELHLIEHRRRVYSEVWHLYRSYTALELDFREAAEAHGPLIDADVYFIPYANDAAREVYTTLLTKHNEMVEQYEKARREFFLAATKRVDEANSDLWNDAVAEFYEALTGEDSPPRPKSVFPSTLHGLMLRDLRVADATQIDDKTGLYVWSEDRPTWAASPGRLKGPEA